MSQLDTFIEVVLVVIPSLLPLIELVLTMIQLRVESTTILLYQNTSDTKIPLNLIIIFDVQSLEF